MEKENDPFSQYKKITFLFRNIGGMPKVYVKKKNNNKLLLYKINTLCRIILVFRRKQAYC